MCSYKHTLLFLFLSMSFALSAQDYLGSWSMPGMMEDGTKVANTVTLKADGTLTVDFASDGTIDVRSSFSVADGVISMKDTSADSPCLGTVGKYKIAVNGNTMTAILIDDPCDERRGDKMVMTRKE